MKNSLRIVTNILLTLTAIAYPLLWLTSYSDFLVYLPAILAVLWGVKAMQAVGFYRFFAIMMMVLLAIIAFTRNVHSMYWYPVLINVAMLMIFAGSLFGNQSIIERFARLKDPYLSEQAVSYTRKVTKVWCLFFLLNIILSSFWVLMEKYDYWAIYNGVIAYGLMGLLFFGEWLVRQCLWRSSDG